MRSVYGKCDFPIFIDFYKSVAPRQIELSLSALTSVTEYAIMPRYLVTIKQPAGIPDCLASTYWENGQRELWILWYLCICSSIDDLTCRICLIIVASVQIASRHCI